MECCVCWKTIDGETLKENHSFFTRNYSEDHPLRKEEDKHICTTCAHEYEVTKAKELVKPAVDKLADICNRLGTDQSVYIDAICDSFFRTHRYLQNEMMILLQNVLKSLGSHSEDPGYEDARNKWALKFAKHCSTFQY